MLRFVMAPIRSGAWLASLAAVSVLGMSASGCSPRPEEEPKPAPPAAEPILNIPVPPPVVGRAEILTAAGQAASAFAAGLEQPRAVADLAGRRFSVRLPFGCLGPQMTGAARYEYDAGKGSLKLTARPETWTKVEAIRDLVGTPGTEAIEGFWIPRPWIYPEACPAMRPPPVPVDGEARPVEIPPPAPTVGLVSTFEAGDSRLQRRGARPYEVVRKAEAPPSGTFRLTLEGRIVEGAGGPIVCRSDDPDRPPVCLVRVEFDRVAIEGAAGEVFGEWR
jgi:hypothetical protein